MQCSAIHPSAMQFTGRCVDPSKINCTPVPRWYHAVQYVGARSTPHRRRAVQSVGASSTPPIPKPISLPPRTRAKCSLFLTSRYNGGPEARQAARGRRLTRPDQQQGEVRIHQPCLPLPHVISLCASEMVLLPFIIHGVDVVSAISRRVGYLHPIK
uniref:Uncharacterized protein n=1 Tax=Triticum urartu TaxID=4572 RepID=A0A8R7U857_TRIUA